MLEVGRLRGSPKNEMWPLQASYAHGYTEGIEAVIRKFEQLKTWLDEVEEGSPPAGER